MLTDYGYFEEKQLEKTYDLKLLRRLFPFVRPYRLLFSVSILLVVLITVLDLSLPYITKIAIDRYIVPQTGYKTVSYDKKPSSKTRYIEADTTDPEIKKLVEKYPELFEIYKSYALISFDNLHKLDRNDLLLLRKGDILGVGYVSAVFLLLVLLNFVLNFAQVMIMEYTGQMTMHDLRMHLFKHIQSLHVDFFSRNPVGRLVTRVTNDIQNMHELFTSVIAFVFKDIFLLTGITAVLLCLHLQLALISFSILPVVVYASLYFSRQARGVFRVLRIKIAEINTRFSETIDGIKVIQLFLHENNNYRSFYKLNHENYLAGIRQIHIFAVFMPVIELLGAAALAVVIYYGGAGVLSESISLGVLVVFISYMKMFFRPIRDIAEKYNILQNAMASAERIFLILDNEETEGPALPNRAVDKNRVLQTEPLEKIEEIEFDDVYFGYTKDEIVLKGILFKVSKGETVAVVGPTGSGKTSLMNLIVRFYEPTSGRILINGKEITEFDIYKLRSKIAIVTQDPFLFSETIRDNITGADRIMSDFDMNKLLDASNCKDFIARQQDGLETVLSQGGRSISSGERQLLSIARAFAHEPDIMILDEATSYIDAKTEHKITKALSNLMKNRTSFVVAHRLSTARDADRILVLNNGRIIESGTHEQLMKQKGYYFNLNQL